jgi:hypothetical protein
MSHTCNPSFSAGGDQEDNGSKAIWAIFCKVLSQKKPSLSRAGGGVGIEFKVQYCGKNCNVANSHFILGLDLC